MSYAWNKGRSGKGCAVLCSAGNLAGGEGANSYSGQTGLRWGLNLFNTFGAGSYYIAFVYLKDAIGSANDDCFWLADVVMPDGQPQRFDGPTLPAGWTSDGNTAWSGPIDPVRAHGTSRHAWRSGVIGDNQFSRLITTAPITINANQTTIAFRGWVSTELNHDFAQVFIYDSLGNLKNPQFFVGNGSGTVNNRTTAVGYPANLPWVLAAGASSDFDYRSHYSQSGAALDFVTSSDGGYGGVWTTDRTGGAGYDATSDYISTFGGTSASAPLAAGIAALVLSRDGNLTRDTVVSRLNENCDKINAVAVPYTGTPPLTRNDYYGYGRLNARLAVNATTADTTAPSITSGSVISHRAVDLTFSEPMGEGALTPSNYQITAGQGTLSLNPNKVIRIRPSTYRLTWNTGDVAETGTVTINMPSGIRDVAGNLLPANSSRNSSGTKRIIGLNCGNNNDYSYDAAGLALLYTPPFISDSGFQGNEPLVFLTSSTPVYFTTSTIDMTGGTAPEAVYQTARVQWGGTQSITYSLPAPSGTYTVKLHFCETYFIEPGYQVFDIYVNGVKKFDNYDIVARTGARFKANVELVPNISSSGTITVECVPEPGLDLVRRAAINGIEIVKP